MDVQEHFGGIDLAMMETLRRLGDDGVLFLSMLKFDLLWIFAVPAFLWMTFKKIEFV